MALLLYLVGLRVGELVRLCDGGTAGGHREESARDAGPGDCPGPAPIQTRRSEAQSDAELEGKVLQIDRCGDAAYIEITRDGAVAQTRCQAPAPTDVESQPGPELPPEPVP